MRHWILLLPVLIGCSEPVGCGDASVAQDEACDDGNTADGDGCDSNCTVTACGNGIVTQGEECDDGDALDGGGCSALCLNQTLVTASPLQDNNPDPSTFFLAIFDTRNQTFDTDGDGLDDTTVSELFVAVSSSGTLCQEAQAAGGLFNLFPRENATIFAKKIEQSGTGLGIVEGETIVGEGFSAQDPQFNDGVPVVSINVESRNDLALDDGFATIQISKLSGDLFSGELTGPLTGFFNNGVESVQGDAQAEASIVNAQFCPGLILGN